jgi:hypothetical protein
VESIMKNDPSARYRVRFLGAELGEDNGEVPLPGSRRRAHGRRAGKAAQRVRGIDRKASQLCRQVAVTLDEVFAACGDGVLRNLHVASVAPFPDASRLLVTVSPVGEVVGPASRPDVVLDHLSRASGHLRFEVTAAVTRKRAPLLLYRLAEPAVSGDLG